MDDYLKIVCPLSNHLVSDDAGRLTKVISAILKRSMTQVYKYTAYVADRRTDRQTKGRKLLYQYHALQSWMSADVIW